MKALVGGGILCPAWVADMATEIPYTVAMTATEKSPPVMASPDPEGELVQDSTKVDRADKGYIRLGLPFIKKHLSGGPDQLTYGEMRVLFGLAGYLERDQNVVATKRLQMAADIGMDRAHFSKGLRSLEERGILLRFDRPRRIALRAKFVSRLRSSAIREW